MSTHSIYFPMKAVPDVILSSLHLLHASNTGSHLGYTHFAVNAVNEFISVSRLIMLPQRAVMQPQCYSPYNLSCSMCITRHLTSPATASRRGPLNHGAQRHQFCRQSSPSAYKENRACPSRAPQTLSPVSHRALHHQQAGHRMAEVCLWLPVSIRLSTQAAYASDPQIHGESQRLSHTADQPPPPPWSAGLGQTTGWAEFAEMPR